MGAWAELAGAVESSVGSRRLAPSWSNGPLGLFGGFWEELNRGIKSDCGMSVQGGDVGNGIDLIGERHLL